MLLNSVGLSLLRGRLGVQVVVDNHTIDDTIAAHGQDSTKRAITWPTVTAHPCTKVRDP